MLKLLRTIVIVFCCLLICVLGSIYSFIRFRNQAMWALWRVGLGVFILSLA